MKFTVIEGGTALPVEPEPAEVAELADPSEGSDSLFRALATPSQQEVAEQMRRQKAASEARRLLAAETRLEVPSGMSLQNLLTVQFPEDEWIIKDLMPRDGTVLLSAKAKAGKTTLVTNLVKALVDGGDFLGTFPVVDTGRTLLIDTEMSERRLQSWYRKIGVDNPADITVVAIRGREASLDPRDPECSAEWLPRLKGYRTVVLDNVWPVLAALGIDENDNAGVGQFVAGFRALLAEAEVTSSVLVHHAGHANPNRPNGASTWQRFGESNWVLTKEDDEDPASPSYFGAFGRDGAVSQGLLEFDPGTLRLTYTGMTRSEVRRALKPGVASQLEADVQLLSTTSTQAGWTVRSAKATFNWSSGRALAAVRSWKEQGAVFLTSGGTREAPSGSEGRGVPVPPLKGGGTQEHAPDGSSRSPGTARNSEEHGAQPVLMEVEEALARAGSQEEEPEQPSLLDRQQEQSRRWDTRTQAWVEEP